MVPVFGIHGVCSIFDSRMVIKELEKIQACSKMRYVTGLQKLHAWSGAGTYRAPKLYWEAQNIWHVTLCNFIHTFLLCYLPLFLCNQHGRWRSMREKDLSIWYLLQSFTCLKRKENLRRTICKIELSWYCAQWALKVILVAPFFSVPNGHVSSNYKPKFLGAWS